MQFYTQKEEDKLTLLKWLVEATRDQRKQLLILLAMVIGQNLLYLVGAELSKRLYDQGIIGHDNWQLLMYSVTLFVITLSVAPFNLKMVKLQTTLTQDLQANLRERLYAHALKLPLDFIIAKGATANSTLQDLCTDGVTAMAYAWDMIFYVVSLLCLIIITFIEFQIMGVILLGGIIALFCACVPIERLREKLRKSRKASKEALYTIPAETLSKSGLQTVQTLGGEEEFKAQYRKENRHFRDVLIEEYGQGRRLITTVGTASALVPVLSNSIGGLLINMHSGGLTIGLLASLAALLGRLQASILPLVLSLPGLTTSLRPIREAIKILNIPVAVEEEADAIKRLQETMLKSSSTNNNTNTDIPLPFLADNVGISSVQTNILVPVSSIAAAPQPTLLPSPEENTVLLYADPVEKEPMPASSGGQPSASLVVSGQQDQQEDEQQWQVLCSLLQQLPRDIVGHRMCYTYRDSDKEVQSLEGASFEIRGGSKTGLVGPSGCGKTTIAKLLSGLLRRDYGQLGMGGQSIDEYGPLLKHIVTIVNQESVVFSGMTLKDNLLLGCTKEMRAQCSLEILKQALKMAGLEDFLARKDVSGRRGFDAMINPEAVSGGQRQRLSLARAYVRALLSPWKLIMIFDEPSSALDAITEALMNKAINEFKKEGHTVIIVAHRFADIIDADEIMVLQEGLIVDRGTHESLLAECELYRLLYREQLLAPHSRS